MKLYFYFLVSPYRGKPKIEFEEAEVIEKPKTYYLQEKHPENYYGCYFRKDNIGKILTEYNKMIVLTEPDAEKAMLMFRNYINQSIVRAREEIENLEEKLNAVNEFLQSDGVEAE